LSWSSHIKGCLDGHLVGSYRHGLAEEQCLQLYGLLHEHIHGFQAQMLQAVAGAKHKEQLLVGVWRAFADLWDDAVQVCLDHVLEHMQCCNESQDSLGVV
jgi:hypothetical protein